MKTIYKRTTPNYMTLYVQQNRQHIQDLRNPDSRERARTVLNDKFDNNPDKDDLRKDLAEDQGYLCCYCMRAISLETGSTKIEHWGARRAYPELILTFNNLLLACDGGENGGTELHCDSSRHDLDLYIDPLNPGFCENVIEYNSKGDILIREKIQDRKRLSTEINDVLNLNTKTLQDGRLKALQGLTQSFAKVGDWSLNTLERELSRLSFMDKPEDRGRNKKLPQFYGVLVFYLKKKIAAKQA